MIIEIEKELHRPTTKRLLLKLHLTIFTFKYIDLKLEKISVSGKIGLAISRI